MKGPTNSRRSRSTHRFTRRVLWTPENLEPRITLDARLLITEIVAENEFGLRDEDGDRSDWIELHNAGDIAADLNGWFLSDDVQNKTKWRLPAVTLQPEQHMIVFASGKDRTSAGGELHANFRLNREGEYLGLMRSDGTTVEHEFSPAFGPLLADRALGIEQPTTADTLLALTDEVKAFVPTAENGGGELGHSWTQPSFDDSGWLAGAGGVGFERAAGFEELIGLDVGERMFDKQTSTYVRAHFHVDNPATLSTLRLDIHYDDGFVAYLNGVEVARENAPEIATWDSTATATHRDGLAKELVSYDLSHRLDSIVAGDNVLSIHGINRSTTSDDFLIAAQLEATNSLPVESSTARYFARPTPGTANGEMSFSGLVAPVTTSVGRGFYDTAFDVELTADTPGSSIVYTTDGSQPGLGNGTFIAARDNQATPTVAVHVDKTTTLRAIAVKDGFLSAPTITESYVMLADVLRQDFQATIDAGFPDVWRRTEPDYGIDQNIAGPDDNFGGRFSNQIIDALTAVPTFSIVTDLDSLFGEDGIYVNSTRSGSDWERATSVEVLMPDGTNVQANAGIRIQGDNVRDFSNSKKQSFRLEFREAYGPTKLRFPLFEDADAISSFDTIILRGAYNDGWVHTPATTQFIRDQWARTTLLAMGNPQVHGRFVHVYLNGFYWGLYNAVERPVASFASSYFGGDKDHWDSLNTGRVRDGSITAWNDLTRLSRRVADADQTISNAAYLRLLGRNPDGTNNPELSNLLDVENYIDYLIVNFYGGNTDWPGRNYYVGREQGLDSTGFKFFAWDTEKILDHGEGSNLTTNRTNEREGVAAAYNSLKRNDEFRLKFADHVHRHFYNGGMLHVDLEHPEWDPDNPKRNMPAATYAAIADQIEIPLIAESARWGDTQSRSVRNDGRTYTLDNWLAKRDNLFERYFPRRSEIVLKQFVDAGLYPELAAPVFSQHGGRIDGDFTLAMTGPGTIYFTTDGTDPRQSALDAGVDKSGVAPSATVYTAPIKLPVGGHVNARTFLDGTWSAINEARFAPQAPPIRVSEIMYHPRDPDEGSFRGEDFEFVELMNVSGETVDLTGVHFSQGIQFEITGGTLEPGERAVVVRNIKAFLDRYGNEARVLGEYGSTTDDFRLSNGGEQIALADAFGNIIQAFTYDDSWIESTDGIGHSLTIIDPGGDTSEWNNKEAWRASFALLGSPGRPDVVDLDDDGETTSADIDAFCTGLNANVGQFDINGNSETDFHDFELLMHRIVQTPLGDVNLDGVFDSNDLSAVFQTSKYEDGIPNNAQWSEGDWNCDGDFDTRDFVVAFLAGSYARPVAAKMRTNEIAAAIDSHCDDVRRDDESLEKPFGNRKSTDVFAGSPDSIPRPRRLERIQ